MWSNPVANAHRSRNVSTPPARGEKPKTGLNAPDLILENMIRPDPDGQEDPPVSDEPGEKDPEGGDHE